MKHFLKNIEVKNRRVFLRADLNVPFDNSTIVHDHRLQAIRPTLDYLLEKNCTIVLATHIGRPQAHTKPNFFDETLSTKNLVSWFKEQNYQIDYEIDLQRAIEKSKTKKNHIILLENLRFFNGEKTRNVDFAKLLALSADVYLHDAFGLMHRDDTSVTLLAEEFSEENRAYGLLVEKELARLKALQSSPKQPFLIVIGGSKAQTKLQMLERLLEQPEEKRVRSIILGGTLANTLLDALGFDLGQSKKEEAFAPLVHKILEKAEINNTKIILPSDACVAPRTLDRTALVSDIKKIPSDHMIVDIGPRTIAHFCSVINQAQTIFANGTMGIYEKPEYQNGTKAILQAIANTQADTIIGGGDAVTATYQFGLADEMSFLSTGGGATLALLGKK